MGASLGCCGGPSTDVDTIVAKYQPLERSFLAKLQRNLSVSWQSMKDDSFIKSPISHNGSRYGLDEHYESDEEGNNLEANGNVTSGSRMLCDFYNLVLECDHSKFFIDSKGHRVKGSYLKSIDIIENHFDINKPRVRSPSTKLKTEDRSSTLSLRSTVTCTSDMDYWATMDAFMQDEDVDLASQTYPLRRRDSLESRRSFIWSDHAQLSSSLGERDSIHSRSSPSPLRRASTERTLSVGSPDPTIPLDIHMKARSSSDVRYSTATIEQRRRDSLSMYTSDKRRDALPPTPVMAS